MSLALFGIHNDGLNLAASLILLALVALYVALVVYTYLDARRRIEDPVIVTCATVGALIPFIGTFVYAILRPPEFLEDARERELEIKAAELRVRQLAELSCPNCDFPVEKNYLRCPNCQRRLKDPCHNCGKPVDPRWALCPYCETSLPGRSRSQQQADDDRSRPPRPARGEAKPQSGPPPRRKAAPERESAPQRKPSSQRQPAPERKPSSERAAPRAPQRQRAQGGSQRGAEASDRPPVEKPSRPRPPADSGNGTESGRDTSSAPDSPERS